MRAKLAMVVMLIGSRVYAADGDLVQPPELGAPQRGSLAGLYAQSAPTAAALSRGIFNLPSPIALPSERGKLLAQLAPSYSPDGGLSEWGMGFANALEIRRWRVAGDLDYATDDLMSPWGRLVRGSDGAYYPLGLAQLVRVEDDGAGSLVAYLPDGSEWTFGAAAIDHDPGHRYAWYLGSIREITGRRATFTWTTNLSGRPFLSAVEWGGLTDSQYRVDVQYEPLPSQLPFLDFSSGHELDLDQRVARVIVSARAGGSFQERWRHLFQYQQESFGVAFYLTEVDTVYPSGQSLPPVRYSYSFAADRLGAAQFAPVPALDPILTQFGADVIGAENAAFTDADLDGRIDIEEHTTNSLLHQTDRGFDVVALPPPGPQALPQCRPAAFSPTPELVPPRTLVRMRPSDDADRVLAFSFDPGAFATAIDVCTREGDPLAHLHADGAWMPGATVRVVDVNRDHQPDLVAVAPGQYDILENTSAAGYAFAVHHTGTLEPALFAPTAVWVQDMNGDGIPDLVGHDDSGFVVWFGLGNFQFVTQGQSFDVRTVDGYTLPSLDGYGFAFVDANHDGLTDLLVTAGGQISLFVSTGAFFQQLAVPALDGLGPDASFPIIAGLGGSGNTEIAIVRDGHAESLMVDTAGTGLLATADDGRGTVLHYSYDRGPAGAVNRPAVLSSVEVDSSGYANTTYQYRFAGPHAHSVGWFLLGYDEVTRSDASSSVDVAFTNQDAFAGVLVRQTDASALQPAVSKEATREYQPTTFQGVSYPQLRAERTSFVGGGARVTESVEHDGYAGLCPLVERHIGVAGTLETDRTVYALPAFAKHLACLTEWMTTTGRHADPSFDFVERKHLYRNEVGLVERIDGLDGQSLWTQQTVTYSQPGYLPTAITTAGKGTTTLEYTPAGLLQRVTSPTGVVTEVGARDERTDETLALAQHHGTLSYTRGFAFDGLERLSAQSDDLSTANPLVSFAYHYPQPAVPGSIAVATVVDAAAHAVANTVELSTARGEAVGTAHQLPTGWMLDGLTLRTPDAGRTDRLLPQNAFFGDPTTAGYADLAAGAPTVQTEIAASIGVDVSSVRLLEANLSRSTATTVDIQNGLVRRLLSENGARASEIDADVDGRTWRFVDPAGTTYQFRHDAHGRLRDVLLPDGSHHRVFYDGYGRVVRIARDGIATLDRVFDPSSGLATTESWSSPSGTPIRQTQWTYDGAGRVLTETHLDLATGNRIVYDYYYDGASREAPAGQGTPGLLTAVSGPGFEKRMTYRGDGKPVRKVLELDGWRTVTTDVDYRDDGSERARTVTVRDAAGNLLETVALGFPVDTLGRSTGVTVGGAAVAQVHYGAIGLPSDVALAGGDDLVLAYDPVTHARLGHSSGRGRYEVHRNNRGLIGSETFDLGQGPVARQYSYSDPGFLTAVAANTGPTYQYPFDRFGLVAPPGGYQLDALGRTVARDDLVLTYGADGQIATAARAGSTWHYAYDEAGRRLLKSSASGPIAAWLDEGYLDANGLTVAIHAAGQLVGVVEHGLFRPVTADLRGTVLADTDGTARLPSPFGDRAVHPDVSAALDYAMQGYDRDLGTIRMGVRDYDPTIARFWTPDPLYLTQPERALERPVSANLYGYTDSDPLRHVDPAGTDWTDWLVKYDHTADLHPLLTAQVNWGRWSGGVTIDFRSGDVYTVKAVQPLGSTHVSQLLAAKDGLKSWAKEMFSFSMTVSVPYTLDKLGNPHILLRDSDVRSIVEGNSVAMSGCRGGFCGGGSRTFANDGGTFDFTGTTSKTTSADVTVTSTHFRTNWLEDVANSFWEATHRNWQLNDSRDTTWHLLNDVYPTKGYLGTDNIQGVGPVPRFDPDAQVCEPSDVDPSQQMSVDPRIMSEP